jgi:hypothetical protein
MQGLSECLLPCEPGFAAYNLPVCGNVDNRLSQVRLESALVLVRIAF